MVTLRMLLLLCLVSACGRPIPLGVLPHVLDFEKDMAVHVNTLIIFVPASEMPIPDAIGVCYPSEDKILIDADYWHDHNEAATQIVYHELGHCTLKQGHREERYAEDGCAKSIMASRLNSVPCFTKHRAEMIDEMRNEYWKGRLK